MVTKDKEIQNLREIISEYETRTDRRIIAVEVVIIGKLLHFIITAPTSNSEETFGRMVATMVADVLGGKIKLAPEDKWDNSQVAPPKDAE